MSTLKVCIKKYPDGFYNVCYDAGSGWISSTDDYPLDTEAEARVEMQRVIDAHTKPRVQNPEIIESIEINY